MAELRAMGSTFNVMTNLPNGIAQGFSNGSIPTEQRKYLSQKKLEADLWVTSAKIITLFPEMIRYHIRKFNLEIKKKNNNRDQHETTIMPPPQLHFIKLNC